MGLCLLQRQNQALHWKRIWVWLVCLVWPSGECNSADIQRKLFIALQTLRKWLRLVQYPPGPEGFASWNWGYGIMTSWHFMIRTEVDVRSYRLLRNWRTTLSIKSVWFRSSNKWDQQEYPALAFLWNSACDLHTGGRHQSVQTFSSPFGDHGPPLSVWSQQDFQPLLLLRPQRHYLTILPDLLNYLASFDNLKISPSFSSMEPLLKSSL